MKLIDQAAALDLLRQGRAVIIPTETVYGLAADATNEQACKSIYQIKGRPSDNPLILHFASIKQLSKYAKITDLAVKLSSLWPGPLTMILPRIAGSNIADCVHGGRPTIAVRIPSHPDAQRLITKLGKPLAAPSANKSGRISPTKISHLETDYSQEPNQPAILQTSEKECIFGLESTIIDLSSDNCRILRPGFITPSTLSQLIGQPVAFDKTEKALVAPGMRYKHYAPQTMLKAISLGSTMPPASVCLSFGQYSNTKPAEYYLNLSEGANLAEAAGNLYSHLHQLDKYAIMHNKPLIYYQPVPNDGIGLAINERLAKAAAAQ